MNFDILYLLPKEALYNWETWENGEKKQLPIKTVIVGENDFNYIEENGSQFPKLDLIYIYEPKIKPLLSGSRTWFGNILPNEIIKP